MSDELEEIRKRKLAEYQAALMRRLEEEKKKKREGGIDKETFPSHLH